MKRIFEKLESTNLVVDVKLTTRTRRCFSGTNILAIRENLIGEAETWIRLQTQELSLAPLYRIRISLLTKCQRLNN